jgi:hypothetical protein
VADSLHGRRMEMRSGYHVGGRGVPPSAGMTRDGRERIVHSAMGLCGSHIAPDGRTLLANDSFARRCAWWT